MADSQAMIRRTILITVLGIALVGSACASDDADSQATSSTQPAATTSTSTAPTTTKAPTTTAPTILEGNWVVIGEVDPTISFIEPEGYIAIDLSAGDVEEIIGQLEEEGEVPIDGELRSVIDNALSAQAADFV
ncbi:MAG: hypothetical protein ACR2N9_02100 [Acidimicrobiia bacterium]